MLTAARRNIIMYELTHTFGCAHISTNPKLYIWSGFHDGSSYPHLPILLHYTVPLRINSDYTMYELKRFQELSSLEFSDIVIIKNGRGYMYCFDESDRTEIALRFS
jgi:hypothetical protein